MNRTNNNQPSTKDEWIERAIIKYKEARDIKEKANAIKKEFNEYNSKCDKLEENLKSLQKVLSLKNLLVAQVHQNLLIALSRHLILKT